MRRLIVAVVLVAVVVVGGGQVAEQYTERKIVSQIESSSGGEVQAAAKVTSFPFVGKLLYPGEVSHVEIDLENVPAGQGLLKIANLSFTADGIELDRGSYLSGDVRVTAVETATITMRITAADLEEALANKVRIEMEPSAVTLRLLVGPPIAAKLELEGDSIVITGPLGRRYEVPLGIDEVAACGSDLEKVIGYGEIRVSCTINDLPPALLAIRQN